MLQVFESWAHHLGPDDFDIFAKPYADKAIALIKVFQSRVLVYKYVLRSHSSMS